MSYRTVDTDIVSLNALHLAATIGPDHWHRTRAQPIELSLHLHLAPLYLDAPGRSDNVADSLHYGHLAMAVEKRVGARAETAYANARALLEDVTNATFEFVAGVVGLKAVTEVVHAVRAVLSLPKYILLAGDFQIELTTDNMEWVTQSLGASMRSGAIVRVMNLILPVLIGVNPPERLAKQRVVTDVTFFEAAGTSADVEVDYPAIIQQIVMDIERSTYLTLEKLVYEIIRTAYRASDAYPNSNSGTNASRIDSITVHCRKPSALSFADSSGVEMTRRRRETS